MKKVFVIFLSFFLTIPLLSQEETRELSDYEKYRLQKEAEMLGETAAQDTIYDTVYVEVEKSQPVVINNYTNYDYPNYRMRLTFGFHYPYYNHWYGYDPFYYDYWYGYDPFWYGYNSYYYPYWGYRSYYRNYYYGHHYYNYGYYRPYGRHYASTSTLGWKRNYYTPYNRTYGHGYVSVPTTTKRSPYNAYTRTTANKKPTATINRKGEPVTRINKNQTTRTYTPHYTKPRTSTRAEYNRQPTRTTQTSPQYNRATQQRSTYNRPYNSSRPSSSYTRPSSSTRSYSKSSTPTRSYSTPSRSYSRSSTPTRSSGTYSRSSGVSRSYSSGSATRGSATRSGGRK